MVYAVASVVCVGTMPRVVARGVSVPTVSPMASMGGVLRDMTWSVRGAMRGAVAFMGPRVLMVFSLFTAVLFFLSSVPMRVMCIV